MCVAVAVVTVIMLVLVVMIVPVVMTMVVVMIVPVVMIGVIVRVGHTALPAYPAAGFLRDNQFLIRSLST